MPETINERVLSGLYGVYRGLVVDVDDPQLQGRVRAFVYGVMRPAVNPLYPTSGSFYSTGSASNTILPALQETTQYVELMHDGGNSNPYPTQGGPINYLPWAEIIAPAGRHKGDIPRYAIGDRVLVMFEYGLANMPFVIGGWITGSTATIPALFPEQRVVDFSTQLASTMGSSSVSGGLNLQFADSMHNWIRADEDGNSMQFAGIPYLTWLRLRSGGSEAILNGNDNFLTTNTESGIELSTGVMMMDVYSALSVTSPVMVFETKVPNSSSNSSGSTVPFNPAGALYMAALSGWGLDAWANDWIGVGQYLDQGATTSSSSAWHQTRAVLVAPRHVVIGAINRWATGGYQQHAALPYLGGLWDTETVDIQATQMVRVVVAASSSSGVSTAGIGLFAQGPIEIQTSDEWVQMGQCGAAVNTCGLLSGSALSNTPGPGDVIIAASRNLILSAGGSIFACGLVSVIACTLTYTSGSNGFPNHSNAGSAGATPTQASYVYTWTTGGGQVLFTGTGPKLRLLYGDTTTAQYGIVLELGNTLVPWFSDEAPYAGIEC